MVPYVMGLMWDHFTPQVQAQIVKDLIAIKNQPESRNLTVYYEKDAPELKSLLVSMGIHRTPAKVLAGLWVLYQTGPNPLEAPDTAKEVVVRDMQVHVKDPDVLDTGEQSGFYLAPQGRNISPTLDLNRPMPAWYPGGPTPDIVYLWGTSK
jgi:hypothetical protein